MKNIFGLILGALAFILIISHENLIIVFNDYFNTNLSVEEFSELIPQAIISLIILFQLVKSIIFWRKTRIYRNKKLIIISSLNINNFEYFFTYLVYTLLLINLNKYWSPYTTIPLFIGTTIELLNCFKRFFIIKDRKLIDVRSSKFNYKIIEHEEHEQNIFIKVEEGKFLSINKPELLYPSWEELKSRLD